MLTTVGVPEIGLALLIRGQAFAEWTNAAFSANMNTFDLSLADQERQSRPSKPAGREVMLPVFGNAETAIKIEAKNIIERATSSSESDARWLVCSALEVRCRFRHFSATE